MSEYLPLHGRPYTASHNSCIAKTANDAALLDRATVLKRVLFSQDEDLLVEAARRQNQRVEFTGVIYAPQLVLSTGQFVEQLELLAKAGVPADFANSVQYLPLR
jgi:hypothetical protein